MAINSTPTTDSEKEFEDGVASIVHDLPKPVQDFLSGPERGQVVLDLKDKYALHVDQAAVFEHAFLLMLIGVSSPGEFISTLSGLGLSQQAIDGLVADVNTRVFMRLRDTERGLPVTPKAAPLPPPALEYEPARPATLPGSPVPAPMPIQPAPQTPVTAALEPTYMQPAPQQHFVHAMPNAQAQPGWHPAAAVHIFVPTQQVSHPQPMEAQSVEIPVATPVPPAPISAPAAHPVYMNPEVVVQQQTGVPIKKEYAADPYREQF